jgi:hypothetical protein
MQERFQQIAGKQNHRKLSHCAVATIAIPRWVHHTYPIVSHVDAAIVVGLAVRTRAKVPVPRI